ncbi:Glycerol-3-phosphate/dihydroxyacetone phosphate acyltransferase [Entomophthora muscae]|uniref:Glycerol-3-phosphate/dihydroxyacetone phosphate acyltransferase n=2 Tax=Entomophthora muscae TaxID=34485 RepID=A0ACC2ST01_9FUNG|nr:Glycerol-3-phosphate/dihydroxyacetone phosphate acyltransferase [Entomophthora muscae]
MTIEWDYFMVDLTNGIMSGFVDFFFRDIEARGSHHIPKSGPVFFVGAPHANQFLDPIVLNRHASRRISYLIAKKSYDRPFIGRLSKFSGSIPVARAQDNAVRGIGALKLADQDVEPLMISGVGTKFTEQVKSGTLLSLAKTKVTAEVVEVISDTSLLIKKPITDEESLEALSSGKGIGFTCIPHLDQSIVYKAVYETFNKGGCVGIFPEGGSHDRTELLPLKAGVAIMSLGAMAANPELDVKIVPCGLNYFHPDRFRSRAVVDYGKPITISKEMVEQFKQGGDAKRAAGTKLLGIVANALKDVTLTAPDYETLKMVQALRRLYQPPHRKFKLSQIVELNRRIVEGFLHFRSDLRIQNLSECVAAYNQQLETFGIRDHQVQTTKMNRFRATLRFFRNVMLLLILCYLTLPGLIINFPIYMAANIVSKRKQKEALATSTVKIAARDVISSWKMLIVLGLGPIIYYFYSFLAFMLLPPAGAFFCFRMLYFLGTLVIVPIISYCSLRFGERGLDFYCSLPPLLAVMCGSSFIKELQETRERLSIEITELANELAPQLYPDLNTDIMAPHDNDFTTPIPSGAVTPNTFSAFNWFMSPLEMVNERLFSDSEGDSSASVSKSSSHTNLNSLISDSEFKTNQPSNHSPIELSTGSMDLGESMVIVLPPSPTSEIHTETKKGK